MSYNVTQSMNETSITLVQPLAYRVWDPKHRSFFYTDVQPEMSQLLERWTGLFDKQGTPLYENDIIRVHYNWKFGWVRARIVRQANRDEYCGQATAPDSSVIQIGYYCFAEGYRLGNMREHAQKLVAATEQFPSAESEAWWLSSAVFPSVRSSCFN